MPAPTRPTLIELFAASPRDSGWAGFLLPQVERGKPCWLVRLGGTANLSGARMRWRIASGPSLANPFDPRAPGASGWDAELFRARGHPPGRWSIAHEADSFHLAAAPGGGALGEVERLRA